MNLFADTIFSINSAAAFEAAAMEAFRYQYAVNKVYRAYADALHTDTREVQNVAAIPFLPIRFFKTHRVVSGEWDAATVFESSGTTGSTASRHHIKDPELYRQSFLTGFEQRYGKPANWCIIGLLPAYLERSQSSLVVMADELIRRSGHAQSGFYLREHASLHRTLLELEAAGQQTLLLGVSFALLDFAEQYPMHLQHTVVMETGGMKGRREELTRAALHEILQSRLGVPTVHSEYGMTELLSQAYSEGGGLFVPPGWMRLLVREEDDPLAVRPVGRGALNIIDLANIHSCCFIAADDVGEVQPNGHFTVQGRMDNSDIRGCSLMVI
jgi:Acyl-protein synthetase, LuxE